MLEETEFYTWWNEDGKNSNGYGGTALLGWKEASKRWKEKYDESVIIFDNVHDKLCMQISELHMMLDIAVEGLDRINKSDYSEDESVFYKRISREVLERINNFSRDKELEKLETFSTVDKPEISEHPLGGNCE